MMCVALACVCLFRKGFGVFRIKTDVELEQDRCKRKVQITAKTLTNKRKRCVNVIKSSVPAIEELVLKKDDLNLKV